jgi:hypothetical protein
MTFALQRLFFALLGYLMVYLGIAFVSLYPPPFVLLIITYLLIKVYNGMILVSTQFNQKFHQISFIHKETP